MYHRQTADAAAAAARSAAGDTHGDDDVVVLTRVVVAVVAAMSFSICSLRVSEIHRGKQREEWQDGADGVCNSFSSGSL